jgi:hypothetical protein
MHAGIWGQHLSLGNPATKINAYMPSTPAPSTSSTPPTSATPPASSTEPTLTGMITEVANWSIALQPNSGKAVTVTINEATVVLVSGKTATAADLKVGMRAAAYGQHLSLGQAATKIYAYLPSTKK